MEREYKARGKKAHKMTRDGLVERDLATGEETRATQRGQDFNLRQPERGAAGDQPASIREALSHARTHNTHRQQPPPSETSADFRQTDPGRRDDTPMRTDGSAPDSQYQPTEAPAFDTQGPSHYDGGRGARPSGAPPDQVRHDQRDAARRFSQEAARPEQDVAPRPYEPQRPDPARPEEASPRHDVSGDAPEAPSVYDPAPLDSDMPSTPSGSASPRESAGSPRDDKKRPAAERPGRLRFDDAESSAGGKKHRQNTTAYQRRFVKDADGSPEPATPGVSDSDGAPRSDGRNPDSHSGTGGGRPSGPTPPKKSKLEFSGDELPPGKRLEKAAHKAEKSAAKLEKARKKLPTRRRIRLNKEFDAEAGKPKRKLRFEKEVKTQRQHLKGPLPLRPVKAGANAGIGYVHKKIHQVEHENVGVEAAHKGALVVEGGLRKGWRMHKTRPYRRVAKLQRKATKRAINLTYQQALHDNPKLRSNLISRMMQKRKIKRQYAKAAREAKRAGSAARKAGDAISTAAKAVAGFFRRHPVVFGILALILLLMFLIMGFFSSCSNMATGGLSSIVASSYLAEDADVDNAELAYTEWETDLQLEIANAESTHSGYDEYRYVRHEVA